MSNINEKTKGTLLQFLYSIYLQEFTNKYLSENYINTFENFVNIPLLLNSPEIFFNFYLKALVEEILVSYPESLRETIFIDLYNSDNNLGIFNFSLKFLSAIKSGFLQNEFLQKFSNIFPDFIPSDEIKQLIKTQLKNFPFPVFTQLKKIFIENFKSSPNIFVSSFSNIKLHNITDNFSTNILQENNPYQMYYQIFKQVIIWILKDPVMISRDEIENTIFECLYDDNSNYGKFQFVKNFLILNNYYTIGENRNYAVIVLNKHKLIFNLKFKVTLKILEEENEFIMQLPEHIKLMIKQDQIEQDLINRKIGNFQRIAIPEDIKDQTDIKILKEFEQFNFHSIKSLIFEILISKSREYVQNVFISLKNIKEINPEKIKLVKFSNYFDLIFKKINLTNHTPLYTLLFEFLVCLENLEVPYDNFIFEYVRTDLITEFTDSLHDENKSKKDDRLKKINLLPFLGKMSKVYEKIFKMKIKLKDICDKDKKSKNRNFINENEKFEKCFQVSIKTNTGLIEDSQSIEIKIEENKEINDIPVILDIPDISNENLNIIQSSSNMSYRSYFFPTLEDLVNALLSSQDPEYSLNFFKKFFKNISRDKNFYNQKIEQNIFTPIIERKSLTQDKKVLHFIIDFFVELEKFEFSDEHVMIKYLKKYFVNEYNFFNIGSNSRKKAYLSLHEIPRLKDIIVSMFKMQSYNPKNFEKKNSKLKLKEKKFVENIKKLPVFRNTEIIPEIWGIIKIQNTFQAESQLNEQHEIQNQNQNPDIEESIKYNFDNHSELINYLISIDDENEIIEFFKIFLKHLIKYANKRKTFLKIGKVFKNIKTGDNSTYEKNVNSFLNFMMIFFMNLNQLISENKDCQLLLYLNNRFNNDFKDFHIVEGIKNRASYLIPKLTDSNIKEIFIKFYNLTDYEEKLITRNQIALADFLVNKYLIYEIDIFIILDYYKLDDYQAISYLIAKLIVNKLHDEAFYVLKLYDYNDKIFLKNTSEDELKSYLKKNYLQVANDQQSYNQIDDFENFPQNYEEVLENDKYEDYDDKEYYYNQNYIEQEIVDSEKNTFHPQSANEVTQRDKDFYNKISLNYQSNFQNTDELKPVTINTLEIGMNVQIHFIDSIEEVKKIVVESIDKLLGIDMEWKPDILTSDFNKGSIMQISGKNQVYIFDLLCLDCQPEFYPIFIEKFDNKTFIAFDFSEDLRKMNQNLSQYFKQKDRLIDLHLMYKEMYPKKKNPGLVKLCLFLLGKTICKMNQCSNWLNRPLTKRQIHYAAMDAYILIELYEALIDSKRKENKIREERDFELIDKKELEFCEKLATYSTRLIELLEFEKQHEEKGSIESIKNQTIGDLRENKIILEDLVFYDSKKDNFLSGYVLTFQKLENYTEIDKGDIIGVYTYQSNSEENSQNQKQIQKYQIENSVNNLDILNNSLPQTQSLDEEFLSGIPIYKAEVIRINSRFISVLCDSEMLDLPENPDFCLVQLTDSNAYRTIKNNLRYMQKCEILNYSLDLFKVLLKMSEPIIQNYEKITLDDKFKLKSLFNKKINFSQIASIENCFRCKELSLIHGPPGTGKTSTLTEFILQSVQKNNKVLVCAYNNIAVDNIAEMLILNKLNNPWLKFEICRMGRPSKMLDSVMEICLDAYVNKSPYSEHQDLINQLVLSMKNLDEVSKMAIKNKIFKLRKEIDFYKKLVIDRSNVVLCTNVGAGNKLLFDYVEQYQNFFDVVIIDEAAQAPEYSCWLPILLGKKVVMAGDHKQLPPTIKSEEAKEELSYTLFEKMDDWFGQNRKNKNSVTSITSITSMLQVQYRSNKLIMDFSSREFYNNQLIAHESVQNRSLIDLIQPKKDYLNIMSSSLIQIDTSKMNFRESENSRKSFVNEGEAEIVEFLVWYLCMNGVQYHEIGVITPYRGQVRLIKSKKYFKGQGIAIASVDGFQGREKEVIILSLVRSNVHSNIGFVKNERRINVALTRAKRLVILIWDSRNYQKFPLFKRLEGYLNKNAYYLNGGDLLYNYRDFLITNNKVKK